MPEEVINNAATTSAATIVDNESTKNDLEELNKLDEIVPPDKEEEIPPKKEEEEEEHKEDEEELPSLEGKPRPTFKEVKEKYPNLFKEFPDLREMFFREARYTEVFPTVEEAEEAAEVAKDYKHIEGLITQGDVEGVKEFFDIMKDNDKDNFTAYTINFLPALQKADSDLYFQVTLPIVDNILKAAYREGEANGNDNLKGAALWLSKFVFNDIDFAMGKKNAAPKLPEKRVDKEKEEFEKEKQQYYSAKTQEFENSVFDDCISQLRDVISDELADEEGFTEYEKGRMVDDIQKNIQRALKDDTYHMARMNALWKKANQAGYGKESKNSLVSAFIARAKNIIPDVKKQVKAQARGKKLPTNDKIEAEKSRKVVTGGKTPSTRTTPGKVDYKKVSDLDILNGKFE